MRTAEQIKERKRLYRLANREKLQAQRQKWREKNRDRCSRTTREYYSRNRDRILSRTREWWKKNKDRGALYHRRSHYGLPDEKYAAMFAEQEGKCYICQSETKLCVDHCHETGRVRNLLCHPCNTAIGSMKEDPATLRNAAEYLEKWDKKQEANV